MAEAERDYFEYKGIIYDATFGTELTRHGGPFDRGSADSYYRRTPEPHYWPEGTGCGYKTVGKSLTQDDIDEYYAGVAYNETVVQDYKDWGDGHI